MSMCKGLFCQEMKKDIKCYNCNINMCKICAISINKKWYCVDCIFIMPFQDLETWLFKEDIKKDFITEKQKNITGVQN